MDPHDTSAYLCTSYSSMSTSLNDCYRHGVVKKPRTLVINFQSIRNKINEIDVSLDSINPDEIIGTESWSNDEIFTMEILQNTYNVFRRDCEHSYGGVLIAVKSELQCSLVYKGITSMFLSIRLHHKKSDLIIISAFCRPANCASTESAKCVVDELSDIRIDQPTCEFRVSGDFRLPDIDYSNLTIQCYQYSKCMCMEFLKLPFYCDLEQMVTMPSRGNNIIDLIFTTHSSIFDRCVSIPGVRDHDAALFGISTTPNAINQLNR